MNSTYNKIKLSILKSKLSTLILGEDKQVFMINDFVIRKYLETKREALESLNLYNPKLVYINDSNLFSKRIEFSYYNTVIKIIYRTRSDTWEPGYPIKTLYFITYTEHNVVSKLPKWYREKVRELKKIELIRDLIIRELNEITITNMED